MTKSGGATLVSGQESGKPTTKYSIRYLLIRHIQTQSKIWSSIKISSEIFNLGEWVGISGFTNKSDFLGLKITRY